jgi:PKD repeat protein
MSDKLNIEQLFRTRFENAELEPSPATWKAIRQKVRWKQFLRFRPTRFNIYYAGILLIAATGAVLVLTRPKERADETLPGQPVFQSIPEEDIPERGRTARGQIDPEGRAKANAQGQTGQGDTTGPETDTGQQVSGQDNGGESSLSVLNDSDGDVSPIPVYSPRNEGNSHPIPVAYFTTSIQSGCAPLTVQFTDQSMHATSYYWDFGTGDVSREKNPVYEFHEAGRYMVSLTTENQDGLRTTSRTMVEVLAAPVADFQIEEGFTGMENHVVLNLINYSSGGSIYAWNLVNEGCVECGDWSSLEVNPTLELNSIHPDSRSVKLEVINENGCSDTAVQLLPVEVQTSETRIKFPNAFSPNPGGPGDGTFVPGAKRIDLFYPVYIEVPAEIHMRIYTRRGELVFETRELYRGWDGYMHQEAAPVGVYVWMVEGKWKDGTTFSQHGDVTVVRNKYF